MAKATTKVKKTKKKFYNVIVIDASTSMTDKKDEVRGGLKELFKDIREKVKSDKSIEFRTIVVDFSNHTDIRTLVNAVGSELLTDELADAYDVRGWTALYDGIGHAFGLVDSGEKSVFVNILTDGLENDSKKYNATQIKSLIDESKKLGWGITFMGTTEDAISRAVDLGISRGNTIKYADTKLGVAKMSMARNKMSSVYFASSVSGQSVDVDNLTSKLSDEEKTTE